jgi:hypothetical protein
LDLSLEAGDLGLGCLDLGLELRFSLLGLGGISLKAGNLGLGLLKLGLQTGLGLLGVLRVRLEASNLGLEGFLLLFTRISFCE